jgi:hypothetical protein
MTMHCYYQLSSKSGDPETPDKKWLANAEASLLCRSCRAPRHSNAGIDVMIQGVPDRSALNFVPGICVGVGLSRFLRKLLPEGPEEFLHLGRVLGSDNKPHSDVATFIGHKTVLIRGGPKSTFRSCPECGRIWYSPVGRRYVLRRDVEQASVLDAWFGTLVVVEEVAQRIIGTKWKNLDIQKLELRDEPVDGLQIPNQSEPGIAV